MLPACELEVGAGEGAVAGGDAGESEPEEPEVFVTASYAFPAAFDIESSVFFMVVGTDLMPSQTNFAKSFAPFDHTLSYTASVSTDDPMELPSAAPLEASPCSPIEFKNLLTELEDG